MEPCYHCGELPKFIPYPNPNLNGWIKLGTECGNISIKQSEEECIEDWDRVNSQLKRLKEQYGQSNI